MTPGSVLVTGANGFVGRALTSALVRRGWQVGAAVRRPEFDVADGVRVYGGVQLDSGFDWTDALESVEAIIHAAARVHVMRESATDPLAEFRAVNVAGTMNLARQAATAGVRRFVFLSTVGVLGAESTNGPLSSGSPARPHSPYATSKWEAELQLLELGRRSGMEVVIVRPPLVHGPGAPGNFSTMLRWLRNPWPLPLPLALVRNKRSLLGIDNLVDLLALCLVHPKAAGRAWLASDAEDVSTPDLLCRMGKAMAVPVRLIQVPVPLLRVGARIIGRQNMFTQLCGTLQVDCQDTRELLGWSPPLTLDQGLERAAHAKAMP